MHWNAQGPGHHNHAVEAQPTHSGATIWPLHCLRTGQILLEPRWRNHQTGLPKEPKNLDFPWNNPVQIQEHQTLKENCTEVQGQYIRVIHYSPYIRQFETTIKCIKKQQLRLSPKQIGVGIQNV